MAKSRKGNKALSQWVTFVKKVQKDKGISYREAMKVASSMSKKGVKWMHGGAEDASPPGVEMTSVSGSSSSSSTSSPDPAPSMGGRRSRRRKTRKCRRSRRR